MEMKGLKQRLFVALGLALVGAVTGVSVNAGSAPASKVRDVCIAAPTGGGGYNMFILRGVESLTRGGAIDLKGFYFTTVVNKVGPLHGTATMKSDGTVRLGFFVHSTAESLNDFTVSGITDASFVGTVNYDSDGDFKTNGTLDFQAVDCATVDIP
jgi:hypothetical protein